MNIFRRGYQGDITQGDEHKNTNLISEGGESCLVDTKENNDTNNNNSNDNNNGNDNDNNNDNNNDNSGDDNVCGDLQHEIDCSAKMAGDTFIESRPITPIIVKPVRLIS